MPRSRRIPETDIIGVIPARWESKRFPGKVLTMIKKRPLLDWIISGCRRSQRVKRWIVATDDVRIATVAEAAGVEAILTPAQLPSGSDRVAYVLARRRERWVVNWQGDEWLPDGRPIDRLVAALDADTGATVATLARPLAENEAGDPNRVKVVLSLTGRALYFSRALIPHDRRGTGPLLLHLGAYLYERATLLRFAGLKPSPLERRERLEQLRLLEHDIPIAVAMCRVQTHGIDAPSDARILSRRLTKRR